MSTRKTCKALILKNIKREDRRKEENSMTKDVLVSVCGYQFDVNEEEAIELITDGEYYFKNGKHYIIYEEQLSPEDGLTKNVLKIGNGTVELIKRGDGNLHMMFEPGKKNYSNYSTPIGPMFVGIDTKEMEFLEQEGQMELCIRYDLEISGSYVSKCEIKIKVESKKGSC